VRGLVFDDEVRTVNALVPELQAQGVQAIVVLIHEGGFPAANDPGCQAMSGAIVPIVEALDPAVDVVVSGHTHRDYVCRVGGRLLTSAGRYGTLLTELRLRIDRASGDVVDAQADNRVLDPARHPPDPAMAALVAHYVEAARPLAGRVVATAATPFSREPGRAGESAAGRLVADAQLAATREAGAQLALMNPGGLRDDLRPGPGGQLRYEDLFALQPFYNNLVTLTLSGAELRALLERQWQGQPMPRVLQVSQGFTYRWDGRRPPGERVLTGSLRLDGRPIADDTPVRVTVNSFLAAGGDNFDGFKAGRDRVTGVMDIDALEAWLRQGGAARSAGSREPRIERVDTAG
jgi:5'-nucleotidase